MGQFDFPSAAALCRLRSEDLPLSPAARLTARVADLGGILAEAVGMGGASAAGALCSKLIEAAPAKDEANLRYFAEWVVWALRKLYEQNQRNEEKNREIEERMRCTDAGIVLVNATLHVPRTNVDLRLQRLAHIFVNGVSLGDLEPESTDDMMRAAVELKEADIALLRKIYDSQVSMLNRLGGAMQDPTAWHGEIQRTWADFVNSGELNPHEHPHYRSSFSRLESLGLIQYANIDQHNGVGLDIYTLLVEGKRFCERVVEIAA